jgi:hypothetical protein
MLLMELMDDIHDFVMIHIPTRTDNKQLPTSVKCKLRIGLHIDCTHQPVLNLT